MAETTHPNSPHGWFRRSGRGARPSYSRSAMEKIIFRQAFQRPAVTRRRARGGGLEEEGWGELTSHRRRGRVRFTYRQANSVAASHDDDRSYEYGDATIVVRWSQLAEDNAVAIDPAFDRSVSTDRGWTMMYVAMHDALNAIVRKFRPTRSSAPTRPPIRSPPRRRPPTTS